MHTTNQRHYLQIKELKLQTHIRQSDIFTMHEIKFTTSKTPNYKPIHNDRVSKARMRNIAHQKPQKHHSYKQKKNMKCIHTTAETKYLGTR